MRGKWPQKDRSRRFEQGSERKGFGGLLRDCRCRSSFSKKHSPRPRVRPAKQGIRGRKRSFEAASSDTEAPLVQLLPSAPVQFEAKIQQAVSVPTVAVVVERPRSRPETYRSEAANASRR